MTCVPVNDSLWDPAQELMNHDCLVVFWDRIKSLLDDVAPKRVHGKTQSVSADSLRDFDDLLGGSVFKATLDQEVSKTIDHQRICLSHNRLHDFVLLFRGANLELLLQKDGGLLVIAADNLVNNILPVAVHITVQQTAVIEGLSWSEIGLTLRGGCPLPLVSTRLRSGCSRSNLLRSSRRPLR